MEENVHARPQEGGRGRESARAHICMIAESPSGTERFAAPAMVAEEGGVPVYTFAHDGARFCICAGEPLRVAREGETLAYAYLVSGAGAYKGTVQFIFYVTPEGRIEGTEVYASSETAGIGSKVLTKDNLARLVGLDLNAITDYGDVGSSAVRDEGVYITGATYTSKSLVNAVRALAYAFAAASGEVTP